MNTRPTTAFATCDRERRSRALAPRLAIVFLALLVGNGCYRPLLNPGIPARELPEEFRTPYRSMAPPLNYANLTAAPPRDYRLGPDDLLEITVPDLFEGSATAPVRVRVMDNGVVHLPLVGAVRVAGMNLLEAQAAVTEAYADGYINEPRVNVVLAEKATIDVVVLGEVGQPGVYPLPRYQNDVGHALAAAGGLNQYADDMVEVHRRTGATPIPAAAIGSGAPERLPPLVEEPPAEVHQAPHAVDEPPLIDGPWVEPRPWERIDPDPHDPKKILRIPLRGLPPGGLQPEDVVLKPGDVVVAPSRRHEVFYVVGELDDSQILRFSVSERARELGTGLVLPQGRDIDVVTAVAMAGYIDPISSPTTVTVHRTRPDGTPLLIRVNLIKARYDRRETIMVQPGDIIYLNPDANWYFRRIFDRIVDDLILLPYASIFDNGN